MTSICAMILLFLCTALFITLDAAPVLPSGSESEAVGEQQFDEVAKTFLNVFSKILTISRDASIQADNELGKNFASNFLSAVSKNPDPNNDPQETLYNEFNPILSFIGKRLEEGGEIQSGDKLMQTIMNLFGTLLFEVTKKTDNGVQSRNESDKELGQTLLNFMSNFAFSDPNNGPQTLIKGIKQILHAFDNLVSANIKNANPNDEMTQVSLKGFHTILTIFCEFLEDLDEGEIQSSDDKIRQASLNLLSSVLSGIRKKSDDGEVQSLSNESDLTGSDAVGRTFANVFNTIFSALRRLVIPKNEAVKPFLDFFDTLLSIAGKSIGNGGDEILPTDIQTLIKHMSNIFSVFTKRVGNSTIQSTDKIVPAAFLNLFSNILSDDEVAQSGLSTALSTVGRKINGDQGSQIQSDTDVNFPKAILNLIGTVGSALQKKVNPKDEFAQILPSLLNTWISENKNSIGGAQEIRVDTLPTYTAKHFDQSMLESMDEEAAMVETNMDLTDEAKIQLWGAILGSLA